MNAYYDADANGPLLAIAGLGPIFVAICLSMFNSARGKVEFLSFIVALSGLGLFGGLLLQLTYDDETIQWLIGDVLCTFGFVNLLFSAGVRYYIKGLYL
jgi:hypothetical protein